MSDLNGKQIAIIVGQKNYNDQELTAMVEQFSAQGVDVCLASNTMDKALGRMDGYVAPDCKIEDISTDEFDALVLVGGYGARVYLWDDAAAHQVLKSFSEAGKIIAAISTAPVVLANAGILKNKKATVYPDYESVLALETHEANHIHESVVSDGNIITANDSRFVEQFVEAIIEKLKG